MPQTVTRTRTRRSRKSKQKFFGILVGVLVVAYFAVTSGVFIRAVVLPWVGGSLNASLSAGDISLSPFSGLELKKFVLRPNGVEPLVTIEHLRIRYGLFDLISGNIRLDEVLVEAPEIDLVTHPDGSSNLSRWMAGLPKSPDKPPGAATETPRLRIKGVVVKDGRIRITRNATNGVSAGLEISAIQVGLDHLENGSSGHLTVAAEGTETQDSKGRIAFKTAGSIEFAVDPRLGPVSVTGSLNTTFSSASGVFKDLANVGVALDVDVHAPEIRQIRLAVRRQTEELARVVLAGPYDFARQEARISYEVSGVDRRVLGLLGGGTGLEFDRSTVQAAGRVDLSQGGTVLAISGKVSAHSFSLGTSGRATPVVEADLDWQSIFNLSEGSVLVDRANLAVTQAGTPLIDGSLDRPMNLSWKDARPGFREANYTVALTGLNLAKWKSLLGTNGPAGVLDANLNLTAQNDGRNLALSGTLELKDGAVDGGGVSMDHLNASGRLNGSLDRFKILDINTCVLDLRRNNIPLLRLSATGRSDPENDRSAAQFTADVELPLALSIFPVANTRLTAGTLKVASQFRSQPGSTNITAEISVLGVNGNLGAVSFADYQARWDAIIELTPSLVKVHRSSLMFQTGFKPGGSLELEALVDPSLQRGHFDLKLANINEAGVGPWMAGSLAPNRLVSVGIDGTVSSRFDLRRDSVAHAVMKVTNLRVVEPGLPEGRRALQFGLSADAVAEGTVVDLQKFIVQLGATTNAVNELVIGGKLQLASSNAPASKVRVTSDGLDFTPLYNLFYGSKPANAASSVPKPSPAPATPSVEPAAIQLPVRKLDVDLKIARILLRQVAVSNLTASVRIDEDRVVLDPFTLSLNGAPIAARANVNLGVPGFNYDLFLDAARVPVKPVAGSLLSGDLVNLHGEVTAGVKVTGAGITGAGLRKALAGEVSFSAKGLDYQVSALQTPLLRTLTSVLTTVLQLPNISKSPIDTIDLKATAGNGVVHLGSAQVASAAFLASTRGEVTLANEFGQSTLNLPISVSVPKGGQYEKLPDFLTMKGTLSKPNPSYDPLAIPGILTRLPGGLGTAVGSGLNRLGETVNKATGALLVGAHPADTNAAAGSKPSNAVGNLLNSIGNALGAGKATSAPAGAAKTNAPPAPGAPDLLPKPRK